MDSFYIKRGTKYIPITFKEVITKDWEDKLIIVRVGSDELPADKNELNEVCDYISDADALDSLNNASFLITAYGLEFEVLGSLKDISNKFISVRVTGGDDLSKLDSLQQEAKKQLRNKVKKVIILPTPLTVDDFKEVLEIKKRCETRRNRRGS